MENTLIIDGEGYVGSEEKEKDINIQTFFGFRADCEKRHSINWELLN
jgi:hypothetical protein